MVDETGATGSTGATGVVHPVVGAAAIHPSVTGTASAPVAAKPAPADLPTQLSELDAALRKKGSSVVGLLKAVAKNTMGVKV